MKHILFLLFYLLCTPLFCQADYVLCIDGGGSKTTLEIVNQNSEVILSRKYEVCSNINVVGKEGIKNTFRTIFENTEIEEGINLKDTLGKCQIIAGLSGAALQQNKDTILSIFAEWGIKENQVFLTTDAELTLQLHDDKGIILICGTGSICFGKNNGDLFRVGGLGRILGDEGSGYQIGLQALKAALAEEYGWGPKTTLTPVLKELYHVKELKQLIPIVNLLELPSSEVASAAALVFTEAWSGDAVAKEIVQNAAKELAKLLSTQIDISQLSNCEVHLWGGIFKSVHADEFLQLILQNINGNTENFNCINYSHQIPATLYFLKCRNGS